MPPKAQSQTHKKVKIVSWRPRIRTRKLGEEFQFPTYEVVQRVTKEHAIQPPDLHEWTTPLEMQMFLRMLVYSNGTLWDDWYLNLKPIGFKDGQAKANWASFGDVGKFVTFSDWFYNEQKPYPWASRIGLFCTWTESWVKLKNDIWKSLPWHTWVAILRPVGKVGFDLLLWDPDHERIYKEDISTRSDRQIRMKDLMGMQQNLIAFLKKENYSLRNVWIGGDGPKGECMRSSGGFIRKMATGGRIMPLPWTNEGLESEGFRWVRMDKGKGSSGPAPAKESDKIDGWDPTEIPPHLMNVNENGELVPLAGGRRSREVSEKSWKDGDFPGLRGRFTPRPDGKQSASKSQSATVPLERGEAEPPIDAQDKAVSISSDDEGELGSNDDEGISYPPGRGPLLANIGNKEISILDNGNQLNDELMNFGIALSREEHLEEKQQSLFYFFNTFFHTRLATWSSSDRKEAKVYPKGGMLSYDYLVIPVHDSDDHWYLVILDQPRKLFEEGARPVIHVYDSLRYRARIKDRQKTAKQILALLEAEKATSAKEPMLVQYHQVPKQRGSVDCGLYVLEFVRQFLQNPTIFLAQKKLSFKVDPVAMREELKSHYQRLRAEQREGIVETPDGDRVGLQPKINTNTGAMNTSPRPQHPTQPADSRPDDAVSVNQTPASKTPDDVARTQQLRPDLALESAESEIIFENLCKLFIPKDTLHPEVVAWQLHPLSTEHTLFVPPRFYTALCGDGKAADIESAKRQVKNMELFKKSKFIGIPVFEEGGRWQFFVIREPSRLKAGKNGIPEDLIIRVRSKDFDSAHICYRLLRFLTKIFAIPFPKWAYGGKKCGNYSRELDLPWPEEAIKTGYQLVRMAKELARDAEGLLGGTVDNELIVDNIEPEVIMAGWMRDVEQITGTNMKSIHGPSSTVAGSSINCLPQDTIQVIERASSVLPLSPYNRATTRKRAGSVVDTGPSKRTADRQRPKT